MNGLSVWAVCSVLGGEGGVPVCCDSVLVEPDSRRPGRVGEEATLLGSEFSMWFTNDYHQAQSLGGLVLVTKSV